MSARKMKDSGIEWIGEIPEEWEIRKLFNLLETIGGGTTPKDKNLLGDGGDLPWLNTGDLKDGYIYDIKRTLKQEALDEYSALKVFAADAIVMAMYGATIGKLGIATDKFTTNQACCVLVAGEELEHKFLFYSLMAMRENIIALALGGGQPNISQDIVKSLRLPLPPLAEQKAIAVYLDEKCAAIDQIVASKQKQNEQLTEYRQSLITEAVNKGLKSSVLMKDSGIEWIGEIPVEWEVSALKYNANLVAEKSGEMNSNRVYIGLENVLPYVGKIALGDEVETIGDTLSFCTGDVLFGKLRPYLAKCFFAEFDGVCSGEFFVIRDNGRMIGKYIKYLMLSEPFLNLVIGSTYGVKMPRASWEFVGNIKLPRPPLAEQKAIAAYLDKKCGEIDALSERNKNIIESLQEYKQSLIYEAVTGKIEL